MDGYNATGNNALEAAIVDIYRAQNESHPVPELSAAEMSARMDAILTADIKGPSRISTSRWISYSMATLTAGLLMWVGTQKISFTPQTSSASVRYTTANAQRASLTLGDGSHVKLAPATELLVTGRYIKLTGQAVFTVIHANKYPFTVEANGVIAKVLGTEFGVRAYDKTVIVAVRSGRVSVNGHVTSQNGVAIANNGSVTITQSSRIDDAVALSSDALVFDGVLLEQAIPDLNRWYDADVRVTSPSLKKHKLLARISGGSPKELAELLSVVLNVNAQQNGRTITLSER